MNIEHKTARFELTSAETKNRDGVEYGVFEGYASTWDIDRGDDIILQGAFIDSIQRHQDNGRPIRMLYQHKSDELIGGFPIDSVREDERGLFVKGEINLGVSKGRDAYALVKQGVLSDMSIGFTISRDDIDITQKDGRVIRTIKKAELWEVSLVDEPMNPNAVITNVKAKGLPIADRGAEWDAEGAAERVKEFGESEPLPFVDVVDGKLTVIPRGLFKHAAVINGHFSGEYEKDHAATVSHYFKKMGLDDPFLSKSLDVTVVESCATIGDAEELLKHSGFSSSASKALISLIKGFRDGDSESDRDDSGIKSLDSALDSIINQFN